MIFDDLSCSEIEFLIDEWIHNERDRSMARNRSYARDNRGRYSRNSYERGRRSMARGYSRDENMVMELRELMEDAPDEKTRMEFERFISKIEGM